MTPRLTQRVAQRGARRLAALVLAPLLFACSSAQLRDDFTVTRDQPVTDLFAALGAAELPGDVAALFPGLKIIRSRPDDATLLYTIPGSAGAESIIRFRFESIQDGRRTVVHVAALVPPERVTISGRQMIISEAKVESMLSAALAKPAGSETARELSALLTAIAFATDARALAAAQSMMNDPARRGTALAALDDALYEHYVPESGPDGSDDGRGDMASPASDPDAALSRADQARREAEWREQRRLHAAGEALDDASGEEPQPDVPASE